MYMRLRTERIRGPCDTDIKNIKEYKRITDTLWHLVNRAAGHFYIICTKNNLLSFGSFINKIINLICI
jgi:hypothetical protein